MEFLGAKFGRLVVMARGPDKPVALHQANGLEQVRWYRQWRCRCECGRECIRPSQALTKSPDPCCDRCKLKPPPVTPSVATTPCLPVLVRPGAHEGWVILIGGRFWTASTSLDAVLAFATETAKQRRTTLWFGNGKTARQVRDWRRA